MWLALILTNSGNHNSNDRLSFTNHKLVDFCSRFLFTEYEMKSDDDWLMNSDNEPGSPITMDDIFKKCERKFKFEDINCKDYHKEVRRILYAKMDTKHKLSGAHFHSFCRGMKDKVEWKANAPIQTTTHGVWYEENAEKLLTLQNFLKSIVMYVTN